MEPLDEYLIAARRLSEWDFVEQHPSSVILFEFENAQGRAVLRSGTGVGKIPTLLVIDADPKSTALLEETFHREFRVLTAKDGPPGIDLALRTQPDVVLSEQRLPQSSGTDVLARVAQIVPSAIRVLMTANSDYDILVTAINVAKIHHYAEKPVIPEQLKASVDSLLRARGPVRPDAGPVPRIASRELRPTGEYRVAKLVKPVDSLWTDEPICLGRSSRNDIVVSDESVSNRHAHFAPAENLIWLSDLGSSNGTSVNGIRLRPRRPIRLNSGDELCFGRVFVQYYMAFGFYELLNRMSSAA